MPDALRTKARASACRKCSGWSEWRKGGACVSLQRVAAVSVASVCGSSGESGGWVGGSESSEWSESSQWSKCRAAACSIGRSRCKECMVVVELVETGWRV
eukprot:scaffold8276_cov62-Phaeocystis_antarctica.AAC.3